VTGSKMLCRALEYISMQTEASTKESGLKTNSTATEDFSLLMVRSIKVSGENM